MQTVRLIVVHGIGSQEVGDTAARWAESLVKFAEAAKHKIRVERADLTNKPAEAVLHLEPPADRPDDGRPPTEKIEVIEAHWADAFAQPSLGRVLRFLLTVAPALAVSQAILIWTQRAPGPPRAATAPGDAAQVQGARSPAAAAFRVATTMAPVVLVVVALGLAAPLVAVLLLLLLLAATLPVPPLKRAVGKYLGWLSVSIGDSYMFVADPVSRSAMQTRLRMRLAALTTKTGATWHDSQDRSLTVVLAHSQGAAVAYHTIRQLPVAERPAALITIGSGLGRLSDVSRLRGLTWFLTPLFVAVGASGAAGVAVLTAQGLRSWWTWGVLTLCASLAAAAVRVCKANVERPSDEGGLATLEGVNWLDIWAPLDLVPNGQAVAPTRHEAGEGYQHRLVPGQLSVLRDHVRYDKDWGQTMPLIWARLLDPTGGPLRHHGVRPVEKRIGPFARRDLVGLVLRLVPVAAVALALVTTDLYALGVWILMALPQQLSDLVSTALTPLHAIRSVAQAWHLRWPADQQLVGAGTLAALGLLGASLVLRTTSFFQDRETRCWLDSTRLQESVPQEAGHGRWSGVRWSLALGLAALIAALVPALLAAATRWDKTRLTAEQTVEAYLSALAVDDPRQLCAVTQPDIAALRGHGLDCDGSQAEMRPLCDGVREALAALTPPAVSVDGTSVTVRWAPEAVPTCSSAAGGAAWTPTKVERAPNGGWRVSEVAVADS